MNICSLFATRSLPHFVPNITPYGLMIKNLLNNGFPTDFVSQFVIQATSLMREYTANLHENSQGEWLYVLHIYEH